MKMIRFYGLLLVLILAIQNNSLATGHNASSAFLLFNNPPTSADKTVYTSENTTYDFKADDILFNDPDGNCFNGFIIVTPLNPDLGELYYDGNPVALFTLYSDPQLLSFVPDPNISGITEFDFRVWDDAGGESGDYTMTIVIEDVNNAPTSSDIQVSMEVNTIYAFAQDDLVYNDVDGDPFGGFIITQLPLNGTFLYDGAPVIIDTNYPDFSLLTYEPAQDEFGSPYAEIKFRVTDDQGSESEEHTITVNVNELVNGIPSSEDISVAIDPNTTHQFQADDLVYNDPDGDLFGGFFISQLPASGMLFYDGADAVENNLYADFSLLTFTPGVDETGDPYTEILFRVTDEKGGESSDYTITVSVNELNGLPTSADIEVTTEVNTSYLFSSSELVFNDPDGDLFGGFVITQIPTEGVLRYDGMVAATNVVYDDFGKVSFDPDLDAFGTPYTSFFFKVRDEHGAESGIHEATINVNDPANEPGELIISEGFSPNADNINDYWHIEGIDFYSDNKVEIYNRWGNLVRTVEKYNNESNAWRGETDHSAWGETVPVGSYFYVIRLGDGSAPIQGYVVINR